MSTSPLSLQSVYHGWDGFQASLVRAIDPLSPEQLAWRQRPEDRSVGEIAAHIAFGRVDWFQRMGAPRSADLAQRIAAVDQAAVATDAAAIVAWLADTWQMVEETLTQWTVEDLAVTYPHPYRGTLYAVSRQWTIWRILSHDIYHGGQLTVLLGAQGIEPFELAALGGHLTEPAVIGPA